MKKRILTILCILALVIMASGSTIFAADVGFLSPKDGDLVAVGEPVEIKYVVSFTAANNQTYCKGTVEQPDGETSVLFSSDSAYEGYETTVSFTPAEEGTYKFSVECGSFIVMNMGMSSTKYRIPSLTDELSVKAVKELPAASTDTDNTDNAGTGSANSGEQTVSSGNTGNSSDTAASSGNTGNSGDVAAASGNTGDSGNTAAASGNTNNSSNSNTVSSGTATAAKKKANTMTVKAKAVKVSAKTLNKKKVTVAAKKAFTVKKAIGKVTYKKVSGSKKIAVSKAGKITVKKKTKKGKYTIKVKVTAAGNKSYKAKSKTVKLTVTVK